MPFLSTINKFLSGQAEKNLSQQELILLLSSAEYKQFTETTRLYSSLVNFKESPFVHIICAQIFLAMADCSDKETLAKSLHLNNNFIDAAIVEIKLTPLSEQQNWLYLITLSELSLRKRKVNDALMILEKILETKHLVPLDFSLPTKILLAKIYLFKLLCLTHYQTKSIEIDILKDKLTLLIKKLKNHPLIINNKTLPILSAIDCEMTIALEPEKIAFKSKHQAQFAIEMDEFYKRRHDLKYQDYVLDDATRFRMEGIFQLTSAMEQLTQKELELSDQFSSRKLFNELKNINFILNKNLSGLINGDEIAIKAFIDALDLSKFGNGLIITPYYKHVFKNILLAIVLLGFGYLVPIIFE